MASGGAGNRTPVPKHFREGIYVCSPTILAIRPCGLSRVCWTGFRRAGLRDNYRPGFFSTNGRRGGPGFPGPRVRASLTCVRTSTSQAKAPGRLTGLTPRGSTAVQQLNFDQLFTWPTDQPRHATSHFRYPVDTRSPPGLKHPPFDGTRVLYDSPCRNHSSLALPARWHGAPALCYGSAPPGRRKEPPTAERSARGTRRSGNTIGFLSSPRRGRLS